MAKNYLHLENGDTIEGAAFGSNTAGDGEVVFTTGMVGYSEALTDPSFAGQILVMTYPHIGSYGVPKLQLQNAHLSSNFESLKIWATGVVLTDLITTPSHYTSIQSFDKWLKKYSIPGITIPDTRALTILLREHGVLRGRISKNKKRPTEFVGVAADIVSRVSISKTVTYQSKTSNGKKVALIDCGVKHGIIRALLAHGYEVTRVPYNVNPLDLKNTFDGVVLSNGPGDPKDCIETIAVTKKLLDADIPILGICLGHQLLALASGADTFKMKFGHRGINQPCQDVHTKKCVLTSQNHGYAVNPQTLSSEYEPWFINLNDGTNEGIRHKSKKRASVQFHPEGNPGPFDSDFIFEIFK